MEIETMIESVKQILERVKDRPGLAKGLSAQSDIIDEVGLDSLEMVDFMLRLEEELGIVIDFERLEFACLRSIRTLCEFFLNDPPALAAES